MVYIGKGEKKEKGGENVEKCEELCPLRSGLVHGASPWRGFRAPMRGAMT